MDGGSTWQNFSSGVDQLRFTLSVSGFRGDMTWYSNNQVVAKSIIVVDSTYYQYMNFDTYQFQYRYSASTHRFTFLVDAKVDGVTYASGTTWSTPYTDTTQHIITF